jgi:hypothetical protein
MSLDKSAAKNEQDSFALDECYTLDDLAAEAGGYFSPPSEDDIAFVELLFTTSERLGIHYYSATPEERQAVEDETLVIWNREHKDSET